MGAFTQNLMFPGQYQGAETTGADVTLSHNWHRTYDPTLGRYLQSDPIGLAGGLNRYAYVGGNPVGAIDPTGEIPQLLTGAFGFLGGVGLEVIPQMLINYNTGKPLFSCINPVSAIYSGVNMAANFSGLGGAAKRASNLGKLYRNLFSPIRNDSYGVLRAGRRVGARKALRRAALEEYDSLIESGTLTLLSKVEYLQKKLQKLESKYEKCGCN